MKQKLIWLNVVLAGLVVAAGVKIRDEWVAERKQVDEIQHVAVKPPAVTAPVVPLAPAAVPVANYSEIAQKMLFSKERNPNVVVVAPAPPPKPPMPPLPILHGVMGLPSGRLALMSATAKMPSKGVRVGEKIGDFDLKALSDDQISFQWEDKTVTKSVLEMMQQGREATAANGPPAQQLASAAEPTAPPPPPPPAANGKPGESVGPAGMRRCAPGDTTPAGTVTDGYKKVLTATPFGNSCIWQPVQ